MTSHEDYRRCSHPFRSYRAKGGWKIKAVAIHSAVVPLYEPSVIQQETFLKTWTFNLQQRAGDTSMNFRSKMI